MSVGWDTAVAGWEGFAPLAGDVAADACVVGLGASGLAAIEAFLDRGLSVVGVDADRVAAGAAGRNGGFLLGGPAPAFHRAVERWGPAAVDLYRDTLGELDRLYALLGPSVIRRVGSIRLAGLPGGPADEAEAADREAEVADCAAQAAALREHGIAVEEYNGPLGVGLYLPDDAATNPVVRATGLAARLGRRTPLHEHTPVRSVGGGAVVTERGVIRARFVVVAVDGRLERIVPALRPHVRTARLQMLSSAPISSHRLPCPVYARWGYDYAQQLPDGRLYVGGGRDRFLDEEWTHDADPTEAVQHHIEDVARRMAGGAVRVEHRWAASVGWTPDDRPLCARVEVGVVAIGGYNGTGNLVGPVTARAAVEYLLDGKTPPAWANALDMAAG
ncbi:Glycine/D-amino acid oxidase [Sinosporangium album]|uniref:Glycine/D-amino acid oxidase n=1 Tax=Sinosporangium album TaxID=504805 RepID=A0A1G8IYV1_9ACTN|nr:FAD-binding oxidoreductase [Sinosporangium album]SDI24235.1 Glycine/D-amino acid oxidase [Sinosporangium album]